VVYSVGNVYSVIQVKLVDGELPVVKPGGSFDSNNTHCLLLTSSWYKTCTIPVTRKCLHNRYGEVQ
jgi:hypothetical protein